MKQLKDSNIKAILFDLDGTLLEIDLKLFIPEYFKLLANSIAHIISPNRFIPFLLKASEALTNNSGKFTNEEAFTNIFFPLNGYSKEEIDPYFTKFYKEDFIKLRKFTKKKPEARKVVKTAFDREYEVVIATNPLLPLTSIQQRLDWAGVGDFPYKLITSYENSYASKPDLLYYQLIFKHLNLSAKECIMVGDEDKDLVCAKLGSQTFLVHSINTKLNSETPEPTYSGTLNDLMKLL